MGTTGYSDTWSSHGRPLTDDSPAPSDLEDGEQGEQASAGGAQGLGDLISGWAERAFGPGASGITREIGAIAQQLTAPGQMKNPWLWVGGAAAVGYVLGRTGVLRPIAGFAVRAALTTLIERSLLRSDA